MYNKFLFQTAVTLFQTVTKMKLFKYASARIMFVSKYDTIILETVTGISRCENYFKL